MSSLSQSEIIKIAAEAGARAAIEHLKKQNEKKKASWHEKCLRNTKVLLSNYRMLNEHIKYAVYDANQIINENAIDILNLMWDGNNNSEAYVESIKRSVGRTVVIMKHIDEMLNIYKHLCETSSKEEDLRRWFIIKSLYIDDEPLAINEITNIEHIESRTVYRDIEVAVEKISSLIFGVDGIVN